MVTLNAKRKRKRLRKKFKNKTLVERGCYQALELQSDRAYKFLQVRTQYEQQIELMQFYNKHHNHEISKLLSYVKVNITLIETFIIDNHD